MGTAHSKSSRAEAFRFMAVFFLGKIRNEMHITSDTTKTLVLILVEYALSFFLDH